MQQPNSATGTWLSMYTVVVRQMYCLRVMLAAANCLGLHAVRLPHLKLNTVHHGTITGALLPPLLHGLDHGRAGRCLTDCLLQLHAGLTRGCVLRGAGDSAPSGVALQREPGCLHESWQQDVIDVQSFKRVAGPPA